MESQTTTVPSIIVSYSIPASILYAITLSPISKDGTSLEVGDSMEI